MCIWSSIKGFPNLNGKATEVLINQQLQEKHRFKDSKTKAKFFISTDVETYD